MKSSEAVSNLSNLLVQSKPLNKCVKWGGEKKLKGLVCEKSDTKLVDLQIFKIYWYILYKAGFSIQWMVEGCPKQSLRNVDHDSEIVKFVRFSAEISSRHLVSSSRRNNTYKYHFWNYKGFRTQPVQTWSTWVCAFDSIGLLSHWSLDRKSWRVEFNSFPQVEKEKEEVKEVPEEAVMRPFWAIWCEMDNSWKQLSDMLLKRASYRSSFWRAPGWNFGPVVGLWWAPIVALLQFWVLSKALKRSEWSKVSNRCSSNWLQLLHHCRLTDQICECWDVKYVGFKNLT